MLYPNLTLYINYTSIKHYTIKKNEKLGDTSEGKHVTHVTKKKKKRKTIDNREKEKKKLGKQNYSPSLLILSA